MSRTILITGGSGKFGTVLASHFLGIGDTVIATCRSESSLAKLRQTYADAEGRFHVIQADLTRKDQPSLLMKQLHALGLNPSCLINNARSAEYLAMGDDGCVARDHFVGEFVLDVVVPYELTMSLLQQSNSALRRVVNIGSMYGLVAANPTLYQDPVRQSPLQYGVAKAALAHLTKELAVRLAKRGVSVNCVAYGGVEGRVDDDFKARYARLCPIGRMLHEDEIPGPVAWLLSDACNGMTGQTIAVDGGWSVW